MSVTIADVNRELLRSNGWKCKGRVAKDGSWTMETSVFSFTVGCAALTVTRDANGVLTLTGKVGDRTGSQVITDATSALFFVRKMQG